MTLLAGAVGCSRQKSTRDYNFDSSEALIACGNALQRSADKASQDQRLQSICGILEGNPRYRTLALALRERHEQSRRYRQAVNLLYDMRYNDLDELVSQAEQAGKATPELLQLRSYHNALQTLLIHCNKRPFRSSEDLAQAMDFLIPYNDLMNSSALYKAFFESEAATLQSLRQQEHQRAVSQAVSRLDWLAITYGENHPHVTMQLRLLHNLEPASPLFVLIHPDTRKPQEALLSQLASGHFTRDATGDALDVLMTCQGLSLMLCWQELPAFQRSNVLDLLRQEPNDFFQGSYCLYALKAAARRSAWEFTQLYGQWQKDATPNEKSHLLPPFIRACGELNALEPDQANAAPIQQPTDASSSMALSTVFSDLIHLSTP